MGRCDSGFKPILASIHLCFGALGECSMVGPPFSPSNTFLQKDPELSPLQFPRMYVIGALLITQRHLGKLRLRVASGQPGAGLCPLARAPRVPVLLDPLSWHVSPRVCRPPVFSSFTEYY